MRGKVHDVKSYYDHRRITPAYAGKRLGGDLIEPRGGDHPRVCGEKGKAQPDFSDPKGSPPRMRGKD